MPDAALHNKKHLCSTETKDEGPGIFNLISRKQAATC